MKRMTEASLDKLGTMIREAREDRQMTQAQLADLLGVSLQTLQGWEQARHPPGNVAARRALKEHLDIDVDRMVIRGELQLVRSKDE